MQNVLGNAHRLNHHFPQGTGFRFQDQIAERLNDVIPAQKTKMSKELRRICKEFEQVVSLACEESQVHGKKPGEKSSHI